MTKLSFMFNRLLIGFGLLLFVLLGFKVWDSSTKEPSEFVQTLNLEEVTESPEKIVLLSKSTTFLNEEMPFPVEAERALDLEMLVDSPILEDLTLGFATTQSMQTFLAQAESNGFRVRDHSSELKTVRLRVSDLDKASRYFDKTENEEV
ncbi:MAG: hypothetical protein P8O23_05110, partial [Opitutales bacterium]|nr:hypothetical protein [Opitutales bacterium]